jgi:hypothetical protein
MRHEFRNINFPLSKIAIAKFGGPIAVTKNLDYILSIHSEDILRNHICVFSNSGEVISNIIFKESNRIVCFDFLKDE